jgi:hypothetical protein
MPADSLLFIGWNRPVRGREAEAIELFQQCMTYYSKLQSEGRIEGFESVLLEPHGGDLGGFVILRGEPAKLDTLRRSDDFRMLSMRGMIRLEGMGIVDGWTGPAVAQRMAMFQKAIK